ncbi:hypothetical protein [Chryseobacterium sp.]|uniref:hypothetical protein n=1 Tax=Chryseobacterium sp. TaxID=1871047 RepID=UPI0025C4B498|nr:hypothetical protein [Chryseobacterium sp.]
MKAAKSRYKKICTDFCFGSHTIWDLKKTPYTEEDWPLIKEGITPYQKSKILFEQALWEYIKEEGSRMELSVVNPSIVCGPVLAADTSHLIQPLLQMLNSDMKACLSSFKGNDSCG